MRYPPPYDQHLFDYVEADLFGGCWLWSGPDINGGYGRIKRGGITRMAHRAVWEYLIGPIPDGMFLDHKCRVRFCVNPAHLRIVTPAVNVTENSLAPVAINKAKTHCVNGHPLIGANLEVVWRGRDRPSRRCRECEMHARQKYHAKPESKRLHAQREREAGRG